MIPKIEEASKELTREVSKELNKAVRAATQGGPSPSGFLVALASVGVEDDPFRISGLCPRDIVALLLNEDLTPEDIRWHDIICNLNWLKQMWPAPTADAALKPTEPAVGIQASACAQSAPAQETPARQELVWPTAEQLDIVKAPKQRAILRKWPELCRRYPNTYNADKVRAGEVSGGQLAGHVGDVDPKSARAFLRALYAWLEQFS
jgi:hypothetical protein